MGSGDEARVLGRLDARVEFELELHLCESSAVRSRLTSRGKAVDVEDFRFLVTLEVCGIEEVEESAL